MYLTGSPAIQALIYVISSTLQIIVLIGRRPYDTSYNNLLEGFNELTVLMTGYLVIVLTYQEVTVRQRGQLGTMMIVMIVVLILVNGLNCFYVMVKMILTKIRQAYLRR